MTMSSAEKKPSSDVEKQLSTDDRDVKDLWQEALKGYQGIVGFSLERKFDNVQSMLDFGTEQMNKFHKFRHDKGKVDRLRTLLASNLDYVEKGANQIIDAASPAFPPAAAIGTALTYILQACRSVSADYDIVIVFFEDMNSFLQRISILESRLPQKRAYQNCLMEVFTSLLNMCGFAHKYIELGRFKKWIINLFQGEDSELGGARALMNKRLGHLQQATEFAILGNSEETLKMTTQLDENQRSHTQMLEKFENTMDSINENTENIKNDVAKLLKLFGGQTEESQANSDMLGSASSVKGPQDAEDCMVSIVIQIAETSNDACEKLKAQLARDDININNRLWQHLAIYLLTPLFEQNSKFNLFVVLDGLDEMRDWNAFKEFLSIPERLEDFPTDIRLLQIEASKDKQQQDFKVLIWHRINSLGCLKKFSRYVKQRVAVAVEETSPNMLYAEHMLTKLDSLGREGAVAQHTHQEQVEVLEAFAEALSNKTGFSKMMGKIGKEVVFDEAMASLGILGLFVEDVTPDAGGHRATAEVLLKTGYLEPAEKTCRTALQLCNPSNPEWYRASSVLCDILLQAKKNEDAHQFAGGAVSQLWTKEIPGHLKRAVCTTYARAQTKLRNFDSALQYYTEAKKSDPDGITPASDLVAELSVFYQKADQAGYIKALRSWTLLERITWLASNYATEGEDRLALLCDIAVQTGEKQFIVEFYEQVVAFLDNLDAGTPLRLDLAVVYFEACKDAEKALNTLNEIFDSHDTVFVYPITSVTPVIGLSYMYWVMGPKATFEETLQKLFKESFEGLSDSIKWNDECDAMKRGEGTGKARYFHGIGHDYVKLPVEGWRGVKNGMLRLDGEEPVLFNDFLKKLQTEVIENAWDRLWSGEI
ncbi:hypothetical protein K4K57_001185 [Colletotrichum sp. SAR 10_99]|nr:hypothetical protein K4K55_001454 [Colletotrichum sp. SAR 10_96]KAJ5014678.1 hypothetical protein K4K57_001185 [Colletotrichum sp. SAR 10_99]